MSAAKLGINAIIVMPLATPDIKYRAVQRFGGSSVTVKLHGQNYDEAAAEAYRLVESEGYTMIHPFNDPVSGLVDFTLSLYITSLLVIFSLSVRVGSHCGTGYSGQGDHSGDVSP